MENKQDFEFAREGCLTRYNGPDGEVVIPEGVKEIGSYVFRFGGCSPERVVIPEGVTKIWNNAFSNCGRLESVALPKSLREIGEGAFFGCESLRSVEIPVGVKEICKDTFGKCKNLESVVIPKSVKLIGEVAFRECTSLKSIEIPISVKTIEDSAFFNSGLTRVHIPKSVESLGIAAFGACVDLEEITIAPENPCFQVSEGVVHDGKKVLFCLAGLKRIVIPEGVTEVERRTVFASAPERVHIPKSVENMEYNAFSGYTSLKEFTVDPENPRYRASEGIVYDKKDVLFCLGGWKGSVTVENGTKKVAFHAFDGCKEITEVILPDSVTSIGAYAFRGCEALERMVLPKKIKKLSANMASECQKLAEVDLPDTLESIGKYAFYNTGLRAVTIPKRVKEIGGNAFGLCEALEEVIVEDGVWNLPMNSFALSPVKHLTILGEGVKIAPTAFDWDGIETLTAERMHIADFPKGQCKELALTAFCKKYLAGEKTPLKEEYLKYIKGQKKKLYPAAVQHEELLQLMFAENMIVRKDIDPLLEECDQQNNVAAKAAVLEYAGKNLKPVDPFDEMEKEFAKAERIAAHLEKTGSLTIGELKKCWSWETASTKEGTFVTLTSWKGKDGPCVTVPEKIGENPVKAIGESAFSPKGKPKAIREAREALQSVTIPEGVTEIGECAFEGCKSLTSVVIPAGVTEIGECAFEGCKSLTSVVIPAGVTKVGYNTFSHCENLTSVTILEGTTEIGEFAFNGCTNLTSVTIPESVKEIGRDAFIRCTSLTSVTIPESVKKIGDSAFYGCTNLTSVTIPKSVKKIGKCAFENCTSLTIHAPAESAAERYAKENGIPFVAI